MHRARAVIAGVLVLLAIALSPAHAEPSPVPVVQVSQGTATLRSGIATFSGGGFAPRSAIALAVDGVPAGAIDADAAGRFAISLAIAGDGAHELSASGQLPNGLIQVVAATARPERPAGSISQIYLALADGLGAVLLFAGFLLAFRLLRRPAAA